MLQLLSLFGPSILPHHTIKFIFQVFIKIKLSQNKIQSKVVLQFLSYFLLDILTYVSMMTAMMTGFIMALIRSSEPYFKFLLKKQFLEYFGILLSEKEI